MTKEQTMAKVQCPACKKVFILPVGTKIRDLVDCPKCGSILEFVRDFPPKMDWAEDPSIQSFRSFRNKLY
jgi:hypothetical protein